MTAEARIEIEYCTQCRWLMRAGWVAQELLSTFEAEIGEVALIPGNGGVFEVRANGETVWSRKGEGRFPEPKELKQPRPGSDSSGAGAGPRRPVGERVRQAATIVVYA